MKIANWFLNKNYSQNERYAMACVDPTVEKETAKAYFLVFKTEFGTIKGWFPKSVCTMESAPVITCVSENVGAEINHSTFGAGKVTEISDNTVTCAFEIGEKKILKSFIKFEKEN